MHSSLSFSLFTENREVTVLLSVKIGTEDAEIITRTLQTAYRFINKSFSPIPTWVPLPATLETRRALKKLYATLDKIIQQHQAYPPSDLLSLLLEAHDDQEEPLSDDEVRDELVGALISGQDGITISLNWILALLAQHTEIQQQLQNEIDEILHGQVPALEDLPQLTYLQKVINEALRLYPQFWTTGRVAACDEAELIEGYRIKKGDMFLISPYVMHRHPLFWPQAEAFDPERTFNTKRGVYIPFGLGQRRCIGMPLALLEMQLVVAMIAQRYTLQLGPQGFPQPMVQFSLRLRQPLILHVQQREREKMA